jgi:lipoprotein NlpI
MYRKQAAAALLLAFAVANAHGAELQCGATLGDRSAAIDACTKVIDSGRIAGAELAKAYYSRGTQYGDSDDHDLAINDLTVSIQLDGTFGPAYYNRALALSAKGDSDRAIADLDAAFKLAPRDANIVLARAAEWIAKLEFKRAIADFDEASRLGQPALGYFGRARAKFYAGDFMGAASDFYRAHQFDPSIYSALWLFLSRKRADIPGETTLAQDAGTSGGGDWPAPIVALYLGKARPEAVQQAATHPNASVQRTRRCEASFYIGEWHLLRGARDAALPLLHDAASGCPHGFIEHEAAVAELARAAALSSGSK